MAKTILICDDELYVVRAVSLKLSHGGYETIAAADGAEALELALRERPDLMITDCQMPRMNGLNLCRELKRHAETREIPVVMLTGKGFEFDEERVRRELGIKALLNKPFSPRELLRLVDDILTAACV